MYSSDDDDDYNCLLIVFTTKQENDNGDGYNYILIVFAAKQEFKADMHQILGGACTLSAIINSNNIIIAITFDFELMYHSNHNNGNCNHDSGACRSNQEAMQAHQLFSVKPQW